MKYLLTVVISILTAAFSIQAQGTSPVLTSWLNSYYDMKIALVNSDGPTASAMAGEFIKASNSIDMKTLQEDKLNSYKALQMKLVSDAEHIATTKNITIQRDYFASLSLNLYSLAKAVKLSDQPVYQAYCPMKKMYWLTNEKSIQNPYYGNMMLHCGSITETINP